MIHCLLMIAYALISLTAAFVFLSKERAPLWTILLFTMAHLFFLYLAIRACLSEISIWLLCLGMILVLVTRVLNGYSLYKKLNPLHHLITGAYMVLILLLHFVNL